MKKQTKIDKLIEEFNLLVGRKLLNKRVSIPPEEYLDGIESIKYFGKYLKKKGYTLVKREKEHKPNSVINEYVGYVLINPIENFGRDGERKPCLYQKYLLSNKTKKVSKKAIHLRVSPYLEGGGDYYICTLNPKTFIEERSTWDEENVTCKKCLKKLSEHPAYMQRGKYKIIR